MAVATPESLNRPIDVTQGCPYRQRQTGSINERAVPARIDAMKTKTANSKRSIFINGQKTSVSLEKEFWEGLQAIAKQKDTTASKLTEEIARRRTTANLSSAIRIFVFNHYRPLETAPMADSSSLRAKAADSRALADRATDEGSRAAMLEIAADYELMAERQSRTSDSSGN
jgi:predicted DNA-binding ribbon-helix-helix protein